MRRNKSISAKEILEAWYGKDERRLRELVLQSLEKVYAVIYKILKDNDQGPFQKNYSDWQEI